MPKQSLTRAQSSKRKMMSEVSEHAVWLQHFKTPKGKDRFLMTVFDPEVKTILDTGSAVLALKQIRRMNLSVPKVMAGPSCWDSEYTIKWA